MIGWYSRTQAACAGAILYELLDEDVTPEARAIGVVPCDRHGVRAVWVSEVGDGEKTSTGFDDMVQVGRVGRLLAPAVGGMDNYSYNVSPSGDFLISPGTPNKFKFVLVPNSILLPAFPEPEDGWKASR